MQGELATAVGELLRKLWSYGKNAVAPRFFKTELARFAPQFSGYNQHDCQVKSCTLKLITKRKIDCLTNVNSLVSRKCFLSYWMGFMKT